MPRVLWNHGQPGHSLQVSPDLDTELSPKQPRAVQAGYFRLSKLWAERSEAEGQLEEALAGVEAAGRRLEVGTACIVCAVHTTLCRRARTPG